VAGGVCGVAGCSQQPSTPQVFDGQFKFFEVILFYMLNLEAILFAVQNYSCE
jgi:hypothetical protein